MRAFLRQPIKPDSTNHCIEGFRKAELAQHLTSYIVLPASRELCTKWAEVSWEAHRKGRPMQTADAWIAATRSTIALIANNASGYTIIDGLQVLTRAD
jgi:predicted nucleic acid-binding protein